MKSQMVFLLAYLFTATLADNSTTCTNAGDLSTCVACTQSSCKWCSSFPASCSTSCILGEVDTPAQCPVVSDDCNPLGDCATCQTHTGCSWCSGLVSDTCEATSDLPSTCTVVNSCPAQCDGLPCSTCVSTSGCNWCPGIFSSSCSTLDSCTSGSSVCPTSAPTPMPLATSNYAQCQSCVTANPQGWCRPVSCPKSSDTTLYPRTCRSACLPTEVFVSCDAESTTLATPTVCPVDLIQCPTNMSIGDSLSLLTCQALDGCSSLLIGDATNTSLDLNSVCSCYSSLISCATQFQCTFDASQCPSTCAPACSTAKVPDVMCNNAPIEPSTSLTVIACVNAVNPVCTGDRYSTSTYCTCQPIIVDCYTKAGCAVSTQEEADCQNFCGTSTRCTGAALAMSTLLLAIASLFML